MPTKLQPIVIRAPAFLGLDRQAEGVSGDPRFASEVTNFVYDVNGRLETRKGFEVIESDVGSALTRVHMYVEDDGTEHLIVCGDSIYSATGAFTSWTDRKGSITASSTTDWHFVNFLGHNSKAYVAGFADGVNPIVWDGEATDFVDMDVTTTSGPASATDFYGPVISAWGRLWAVSQDRYSVYYSGLLGGTTSSFEDVEFVGTLTVASESPSSSLFGPSKITGIAEFQNKLLIFTEDYLTIYSGLEVPTTAQLVDTIGGIGCINHRTIQNVGKDIIFADRQGLRSLSRAIQYEDSPVSFLTERIRDDIISAISGASDIYAVYSRRDAFYLLVCGTQQFCLDLRQTLQDGTYRITKWSSDQLTHAFVHNNNVYLCNSTDVGIYRGYVDNGSPYRCTYKSTWVDFETQNYKILKKFRAVLFGGDEEPVTFSTTWGFSNPERQSTTVIPAAPLQSEWNESEWGIGEFGDRRIWHTTSAFAQGYGQRVKFGLQFNCNGNPIAIEQIELVGKIGRLV